MAGGRYVDGYMSLEVTGLNEEIQRLSIVATTLKDISTYETDMDEIGKYAKEAAQDMILKNGSYVEGDLYKSVDYQIKGNKLALYADAFHSPFIEFGFKHHESGAFLGPWPYLRPAMAYAAARSTGKIEEHMVATIEEQPWNFNFGAKGLQFGRHHLSRVGSPGNRLRSSYNRGRAKKTSPKDKNSIKNYRNNMPRNSNDEQKLNWY